MTEDTSTTNWRAWVRHALPLALLLLGACSSMHRLWPRRHAPPAPEALVHELVAEAADGAAAPALAQTWDRNTLRIALNSVAGEGEFKLRPLQGHEWPIRLEFAVQPGSFAHLELRGEQRVILSVPVTGGVTVLSVPQGVYAPTTTALTLHYGP